MTSAVKKYANLFKIWASTMIICQGRQNIIKKSEEWAKYQQTEWYYI